jgi:(p)ppGpp synthase/HD superfamily hydrolase
VTNLQTAFEEALILAATVHQDQKRKKTQIPYITHPVQVARVLERHDWPEPVVLAGLLHDVLEDLEPEDAAQRDRLRAVVPRLRDVSENSAGFGAAIARYIEDAFGRETLRLVEAVTERKADQAGTKRPWLERKLERLDVLRQADRNVAALKAADLLHNATAITRDIDLEGPIVLRRFNATAEQTLWHYRTASAIVSERLGIGDPLAAELDEAVGRLERAVQEAARDCPREDAG